VSTKTCPSCGAEVPVAAARCKHCFHEFGVLPKRKVSGLLVAAITLAAMALTGAGTMYWIVHHQAVRRNVVIDQETHSVVWTATSSMGTKTDRLPWDEIKEIEIVTGGSTATWEVYANTTGGERRILNASNEGSLVGYSEHVSQLMGKPLIQTQTGRNYGESLPEEYKK
jgi:ribosomal protein L40E